MYLKMKTFVSSPRLYIVGKYSPTPYLNVSIGIGRVFYTGIVVSSRVTGGYCSLLGCGCRTLHVLAPQASINLTSDGL